MKIQEIATLAGVSTATVSRVFSHHPNIRSEVRKKVFAVARNCGYRPRLSGKRKNIVVISPYKQLYPVAEYVEMVTTELIRTLAHHNFRIEILPHDSLDRLNGISFSGAISIGMEPPEDWEERFALPLVMIDLPLHGQEGCCSVRSDEEMGMALAIGHLAERGCRHVGSLIHGVRNRGNVELRRNGVFAALSHCGLPAEERLVQVCLPESFMEEIGKLLRLGIDGLLCCGGSNAGGIAAYCLSLFGKRIPDDIRLVSSERTHISRYCIPPQTTISQDYAMLAENIVERIEDAIEGRPSPPETILPYHLIVRDSS